MFGDCVVIPAAAIEAAREHAGRSGTALLEPRSHPSVFPESAALADVPDEGARRDTGVSMESPLAAGAEGIAAPLVSVPVRKVRFLQAMAEDGPGARPCRIGGHPLQRVIQRTTC